MPIYLYPVETANPETFNINESIVKEWKRLVGKGDRKLERILYHLYMQSGIEKRHSAFDDFVFEADGRMRGGMFYDRQTDTLLTPTTAQRNQVYTETAKALIPPLAKAAIEKSGFAMSEITHIVTVSCTGFFQPGVDYHIVRTLNLPIETQRYHLGFMGCYAAFPALKMAKQFCEANPNAVVLVVCLELCSLHLRFDNDMDNLLGSAIFADGAGAVVVSGKQRELPPGTLAIERLDSTLTPNGEEDMAWTIGDTGFVIRLSTYVPEILQQNIGSVVEPILAASGVRREAIRQWAIHPGGRAILDKVQSALELCDASLIPSRQVLRQYGNMSSSTILFVLKEMQQSGLLEPEEPLFAMAFGPGLTVESGLLRRA